MRIQREHRKADTLSILQQVMIAVTILLLFLVSGCAFADQKVSLVYDQTVGAVSGGRGEDVYVETPVCAELEENEKGLFIIGSVKNTYGMRTADTVTEDVVPEWVADALCQELQAAGFTPHRASKLPSTADRGVCTRVIKVWVDQDPGFWTVGAIGEVQLRMALYRDGSVVREFDVESKGQGDRSMIAGAKTKEESLKVALETCMQEAVPLIVETFKESR